MRKRKKSVLLFLVLVLILSGCGTKTDVITITNVSYDPTREFYEAYNPLFEKYYKEKTGKEVNFMNLIIRCLKNIIRRLITRKFR